MASQTSILSYAQLKASGQNVIQAEYILELIKTSDKPLNSRQISKISGLERTNVTRSLNDLSMVGKIHIANYGKCQFTRKWCQFYGLSL